MTHEEYLNAINQLNNWTMKYDEGNPEVSDKIWDDLYYNIVRYELHNLDDISPDSPTQIISYEVVSQLEKVKHSHPMLSLDKTKDIEEFKRFIGNNEAILMLKMDGLTCSLRYENGILVAAETRGNGEIGENILHNAKVVKNIPKVINITDRPVVIDGEIICKYDDFEPFSQTYKNPRNFASGSIRLLDSQECEKRNLTFVAWDCIEGIDKPLLSDKLFELNLLGFTVVDSIKLLSNDVPIEDIISMMQTWAKEEKYPIDGIVVKYDNVAKYKSMGKTNHHANGGLAFKFYDETYPTTLRDIEWTMGRTGQLTPVAVFDPVEIDGTIVERASLHNVSIMKETLGKPYIGQKLEVSKRNMIIPQIEWAEK